MKKLMFFGLMFFLINVFPVKTVFADEEYAVTGIVESFDRAFAKIKVEGKTYRLSRTLSVHSRLGRGELEVAIGKGDRVGLVFVGSSVSSGVKQVWLLARS